MTMSMARSLPVNTMKSGLTSSRIASLSHSGMRSSEECLAPTQASMPRSPR